MAAPEHTDRRPVAVKGEFDVLVWHYRGRDCSAPHSFRYHAPTAESTGLEAMGITGLQGEEEVETSQVMDVSEETTTRQEMTDDAPSQVMMEAIQQEPVRDVLLDHGPPKIKDGQ